VIHYAANKKGKERGYAWRGKKPQRPHKKESGSLARERAQQKNGKGQAKPQEEKKYETVDEIKKHHFQRRYTNLRTTTAQIKGTRLNNTTITGEKRDRIFKGGHETGRDVSKEVRLVIYRRRPSV